MNSNFFSSIFLPGTLALITLGMGLTLLVQDFRNILLYPKAFIVGLVSQMVLLPILAFGLAWISPLSPEHKAGLILIAICPGGATSNLVNHMLRSNVALSISLAAVNSLITVFSIPILYSVLVPFFISEGGHVQMNFMHTVREISLIVVLPVLVGMFIRARFPDIARRVSKPLDYVMPGLLLVAFLGVMFLDKKGGRGIEFGNLLPVYFWAFVLNISALLGALWLPRMFRLRPADQITIMVETSLQNSSLALVIAITMLGNHTMAEVAVAYGSFTFFSTLGFGALVKQLWLKRFPLFRP